MTVRALLLAGLLAVVGAPVASGLSTVHVDFGYGPVAPGYVGMGQAFPTDYIHFYSAPGRDLGGGVLGGWNNYGAANAYDLGSGDPLLQDFLYWYNGASNIFEMDGVQPGAYSLTVYGDYPGSILGVVADGGVAGGGASFTVNQALGQTSVTVPVTVSSAGVLLITFSGAGASGMCNGFDLVSGVADTTPPAAVSDLVVTGTSAATASLRWTAPSDVDSPVASYDIRYSTSLITDTNWSAATQAAGEPAPAAPGTQQTFTVTGLAPATQYYFAIKSADGSNNVSALSNVPSGTTGTPDTTAPTAITNLSVSGVTSSAATLQWTAPSDIDDSVVSYDIRYSTSAITGASFASATPVVGTPAPSAPGAPESFTVSGLNSNTTYYFAIKSADGSNNVSALSNVPSAKTAVAVSVAVANLDFQPSAASGFTAPGYIAIDGSFRWDTGPQADLGNGIKAAWTTAFGGDNRDRATADPLTRDFLMWWSGSTGDTLQFRGLRPGNYDVEFHSTDTVYGGSKTSFALDANNDGAAEVTITIQASLAETVKTTSVTVSSAGMLSVTFAPYGGGNGLCNGLDLVSTTPDTAAPAAIPNLAASLSGTVVDRAHKVNLAWTAPADDNGAWGRAASYDLRYSTAAVTEANWDAATAVAGLPVPAAAGQQETFTVTGLEPSTTYHFAIKSADSAGNVSSLSNVAAITTGGPDVTAPGAITNLAAAALGPNWIKLAWTATGDNGMSGQADHYELRYSAAPITEASWANATLAAGMPAPKAPGAAETFTVHGLAASTQYYFAIKVFDAWPNASALSNVVSPTTLAADTLPPLAITDLRVAGTHIHAAFLTWTAPADQGTAGTGSYQVRYATSEITEASWASATPAACSLVPAAPGTAQNFTVTGLQPNTAYYFAVKTLDYAEPANVSAASNSPSGSTMPPPAPVTIRNPWITNDRVADCRTLQTMAATFDKAYTPDGVVAPSSSDIETRAINEYNNFKRRLYHWGQMPPNNRDVVEQMNVFGWALCGSHASMNAAVLNAMGLHPHTIGIASGAHTIFEVNYNGKWHALDTMTTYYVWSRTNPRYLVSMAEVKADHSLALNAAAEGRACPGFLLCGDTADFFATGADTWTVIGDPGDAPTTKSMDMDLRIGESVTRTWESWANQYTDQTATPPYHHEANKDWKDTVNIPYWEPYQLTSAQSTALNIPLAPTYRRWANGTCTLAPDFQSPAYQASLASSANIATYNDDSLSPDLHVAAPGTMAEAVFKVATPYLITDAAIDGTFVRTSAGDVNRLFISKDGTNWTQVWDNTAVGTTQLSKLGVRTQVFGGYQYWVKVQLKATAGKADAGVSNLAVTTTFEHNKGGLPYLDKGVNHITVTLDNASDLASGAAFKVTYKWKEYDGTNWTIDKSYEQYVASSPTTFTITAGGTKVPRTEYIRMEVVQPPMPDSTPPAPVTDLAVAGVDSTKVDLAWTATGDDWVSGQASIYDVRYSTAPINNANFDAAARAANPPGPQVAGSHEQFAATGLLPATTYYFAMKVKDEGGNVSDISNVVSATTLPPDVTPPDWVKDLVGRSSKTAGAVDLTWTATGDDGAVGTAAGYDLRYSTSPIDESSFAAAAAVTGEAAPKAAGAAESFTVTGLTGGTFYYFAMKVTDDAGNVSEVSNITYAFASTLGEKTLQYGLNGYTATKDNYAEASSPTVPYGDRERMRICGFADSALTNRQRGFIQFDVTSIPAGTTITSATLCLYAYDPAALRGSTGFYGLYPLTRDFDQMTSCWNLAATGVSWTTPGGDFINAADSTSPKQGVAGVWYPFDVTARVQSWVAGTGANHGWLIKVTDENVHNQDCFYALDTSNASLRPKLVVSDMPASVAGDATGDGHVDVVDLLFLVDSFGWVLGDRGYDPKCDFNSDGSVDVIDLLTLVETFGT